MITSMSNTTVKELMKLKQKKYRDQTGYYLVEGEHLVEAACKKGVVSCLISTKALDCTFPCVQVSQEVMEKLAFTKTPQPIMAKCEKSVEMEIVAGKRYLLLDDLQDPGNIGTLIRSALAFGIDQVILSLQCVDIYNDKVLRSMQGAHFEIPCIYQDLQESMAILKQNGVVVVGSALQGGQEIHSIEKSEKMAMIVGNEGNGMHKELLENCDAIGYIPIRSMESLNVAIAGSIMMYHFTNIA